MKKLLICLLIVCAGFLQAEEVKPKTICLNMIVRNESGIIKRCLASVKDFVDYWVIVDTGSTDGTKNIIRKFMQDVPGELHDRAWVDFAHNRTEALALAKGKADYVLFIDADEQMMLPPGFNKLAIGDKDLYVVNVKQQFSSFQRVFLVNNQMDWSYTGVLYELIKSPGIPTNGYLPITILANTSDGYRSKDPDKPYKDIAILEKALEKEPTNTRYVWFLAENYETVKEYDKAIAIYGLRSMMGGWDHEVYHALYKIGILQEKLEKPIEEIMRSYSAAAQVSPGRADPLFRLGAYLSSRGLATLSYALMNQAGSIPFPKELPYTEKWIYDYGIGLEKAVSAGNLGFLEEAIFEFKKVLAITNLPQELREDAEKNLAAVEKMAAEQKENK